MHRAVVAEAKRMAPGTRSTRPCGKSRPVFPFVDTFIAAIAIAQSYCWESPKPTEFGSTLLVKSREDADWFIHPSEPTCQLVIPLHPGLADHASGSGSRPPARTSNRLNHQPLHFVRANERLQKQAKLNRPKPEEIQNLRPILQPSVSGSATTPRASTSANAHSGSMSYCLVISIMLSSAMRSISLL